MGISDYTNRLFPSDNKIFLKEFVMPIYEYQCEKCDCLFEQLVSLSRKESVACPKCGSRFVKKRLSCFASTGVLNDGGCDSTGSKGFS
jgi:putative FmdB family regulatory protein